MIESKPRDTVRVNDVSETGCPTTCNCLSLATNYGTNDNGDKNVKVTVHVHVHATLHHNQHLRKTSPSSIIV